MNGNSDQFKSAFEALLKEKADLVDRLRKIETAIQSLAALDPNNQINPGQQTLFRRKIENNLRVTQFKLTDAIQDILADKESHKLEHIADALELTGFDFKGKSPKRAVNFALQGLKNAKRVGYDEHGWRLL